MAPPPQPLPVSMQQLQHQAEYKLATQFTNNGQPPSINSNSNSNNNYNPNSVFNLGRIQYSPNFYENYEHLCALQSSMPLQAIRSCLSMDGSVNLGLNVDKLKLNDWDPLLGTLRVNKNVKSISLISSYIGPHEADPSESARLIKGYAKLKRPPAIRSNERLISKLCRALKDCLSVSHHLEKLEIYNLPLSVKDCAQIAKGLRVNKSLKLLSLERCFIGDEGLNAICKDIQNSSNLNRVNFCACKLTHEGAGTLATLIKVQALKRHNEAWKDSLRYGRPDLDNMFGIRRITANANPLIGDQGVKELAEAFKSDLWLKALDLQNCGITTVGANYLLDGLKFNAMMHVLDVRLNVDIDRDTLQKIMEQVMINSSGNNTEYEWMDLSQKATAAVTAVGNRSGSQSPKYNGNTTAAAAARGARSEFARTKKRRNTNSSFNKKPQFNTSVSSMKMKRCKSTGSVVTMKSPNVAVSNSGGRQQQHQPSQPLYQQSGKTGIPWRAAARANRYRISNCAYRQLGSGEQVDMMYEDEEELDEFEDEDEHLQNIINGLDINEKIAPMGMGPPVGTVVAATTAPRMKVNRSYDDLAVAGSGGDRFSHMSSTFDTDKFAGMRQQQQGAGRGGAKSDRRTLASNENIAHHNKSEFVSSLDKIKNASVKDYLVILQKEQESKAQLEDMLIGLQGENTKLKSQISVLRTKLDQQQIQITSMQKKSATSNSHQQQNTSTLNRTLLDDDRALEIIELTLYKYQQFLDFLRNAGFGKLIEYSEINQEQQQQQQQQQRPQSSAYQKQQALQNSKLSSSNNRQNRQQQQQPNTKYSSSSSKSPVAAKSKSKSPISDEQRYYLSKINKTKSKLINDSYNNTTLLNNRSMYDTSNSTINNYHFYNYDEPSMNIDTLLSSALDATRSYRRMNSSSLNNTTLNTHHHHHTRAATGAAYNINHHQHDMLSEIEEANRENSMNSLTLNNESSMMPNIEELQKTTETLLEQYKKSKALSSADAITAATTVESSAKHKPGTGKRQAINTVSLSPEETKKVSGGGAAVTADIGNNLFLFPENLQDISQASMSEHHNKSTSSPPITIVVNKPSQPPAVSARSISSTNTTTKKTSISEHLNEHSKSRQQQKPSNRSYSNDDFDEDEDGETDKTENVLESARNRDFVKKGRGGGGGDDFNDDGVESFEDDDF